MEYANIFNHFAADFERCIADDNWSRLARYLTEDATYRNVGGPEGLISGRKAILDFFKKDVSESDSLFDTRELVGLTEPTVSDDCLSRKWRTTYTLPGAPDLVVDGEARYWFAGDLIRATEQELSTDSASAYATWMREHGDKLHT